MFSVQRNVLPPIWWILASFPLCELLLLLLVCAQQQRAVVVACVCYACMMVVDCWAGEFPLLVVGVSAGNHR